ncbi:chlorophyllase [Streptomyces sp. NPDC005236]|uniref:alpha/beta hydrolase family protein n=1 Tax=Streptomyces sp. NPDC005236 TaxID=3157028 RepID=UPI0033BBD40F
MSAPISEAGDIPVSEPTSVVTYSPVVLDVPGRAVSLEMKVSAPETGSDLPVILLSHGHGMTNFLSSLNGYGPLANFWAAHGFVVIQPTHLDSVALGLREADDPQAPLYWRTRGEDMHHILDRLDEIEAAVPGLAGRLDRGRIAVAGHSLGGATASMLLGMRVTDPNDGIEVDLTDARVKAGVIFGAPGSAEGLADWAAEHYPVTKGNNFSNMRGKALVIAGDKDLNPNFSERLSYRWDTYTLSPGPKTLLTVFGAEHMFGGISGYDAVEASDENPERVSTLRALAWAYLRSALYEDDASWDKAVAELEARPEPFGRIESK